MPQSQQAPQVYDAIEALIKSVVPEDCRIFQANMPLQLMGSLERETMRICTYLLVQDRVRNNASGSTPVHEILLEVSFYGSLEDVDTMSKALTGLICGQTVTSEGWSFALVAGQAGKRDVWEPRITVKREHLQFRGFAIEPEG